MYVDATPEDLLNSPAFDAEAVWTVIAELAEACPPKKRRRAVANITQWAERLQRFDRRAVVVDISARSTSREEAAGRAHTGRTALTLLRAIVVDD